jgi:hypothetical protein
MDNINNQKEMLVEVARHQKTILFSRRKDEISSAFKRLECIATGKCISSTAKDIDLVFEYVRCIIPSRFFQLIKELHASTNRWQYIQPLYRQLYAIIYEDLNPDKEVISNGPDENVVCATKLPKGVLKKADKKLDVIEKEEREQAMKLRKLQYDFFKLKYERETRLNKSEK